MYEEYKDLAKRIRKDCLHMTHVGQSGHIGSMLSAADMMAVLYGGGFVKNDPKNPNRPDRDRFIMSKGHAGAVVYATLAELGYFPKEWMDTYYQDDGKLMGHISHYVPGVEYSTGSLGHGLSVAVGMALAAKEKGETHKIYCMTSDGDCNEGSTFAGVHVIDEPCIDGFPENFDGTQKLPFEPMPKYAALMRRLHNYDNMTGYINLLPIYHWMNCTADDYRKYLTEFLETCNPRVISFDHYLFEDRNLKRELKWFFINLSVVCEYSKKSGIPFWAFAQCGHQWNFGYSKMETDTYLPTKQQFFWIVNTNLAFGAKGIQYFPIVQEYQCALYLDGGLDCDRSAILGADGEPTMWHGFVRQSNKQVKAVGSILMQCELQGVLALKDAKLYCEGLYPVLDAENYKELTSVQCRKSGVFIGCFDYQGKTAFYVVNNDTKKCQNVKLGFDDVYQVKLISDVGERQEATNSCKITLGAGKAVLVILQA